MSEMLYCEKCRRTLNDSNFYTYSNGTKCELCKPCLTMHVDNYDESTFLWILEKFDVPYVPGEWNTLRDKAFQKDPYKMTGMSVLGKYLSKMKLKQWKNYTYADSEKLQAEIEEKARLKGTSEEIIKERLAKMEESYKNGEITESQWLTYKEMEAPSATFVTKDGMTTTAGPGSGFPYPVNDNPFEKVDLPDPAAELTEEDKIYLATKWGRLYSAADWVSLEKSWTEYEKSFDLHNADLINGTKQLCKLDLKGNQALDTGDIDSYSKIARASDSLRKSLKFTEAQRKEDKKEEFDCYGLMVAFAEKHNNEDYIKSIDLSVDRDIVDKDIRDIKKYTKTLIEDDPAVFKMIEQYIKKREIYAEHEKDIQESEEGYYETTDDDLKDFNDAIEEQRATDNNNRLNYENEEEDD